MSSEFNEKNYSMKMEKSIVSFKKDISTLRNISQNDRILDSMKSNFNNINIPNTLSIISNFILEKKYAL